MTSLGQLVKDTARSAVCQAAANAQEFNQALKELTGYNPPIDGPAAVRGAFCNNPTPGPLPQAPYSGGQCAGVGYRIQGTHNAKAANNGNPVSGQFSVGRIGPITSVSGETVDSSGFKTSYVTITHQGGTDRVDSFGGCEFVSVSGVTVTRLDGQPDNCGNPPVPPAPFPPAGLSPQVPAGSYLNDAGQQVNVQPTVKVRKPFLRPDGGLSVNVEVNVGGVVFDTDVNFNTGNININFGGNRGNKPPGDDRGNGDYTSVDEDPPNTGTPGEQLPTDRPPEGERRIVGVIVSSTSVSSKNRLTTIFQQGNPNIFAPSLGHVNFLCRIGDGRVAAWTEDVKVKNRRMLIPCPWPQGAVDVKGTPNAGVAFTLTPVYDEIQSQVEG